MKCPHCREKVGVFSRAVNSWGKKKFCPHCAKGISIFIPAKGTALISGLFTSFIIFDDVIQSYIGINGLVVLAGVVGGYAALSALKLKPRNEQVSNGVFRRNQP